MAVSTKSNPTLKSIIIATCQEFVVSLKTYYGNIVESMFGQVRKQDLAITELMKNIVSNQTKIIQLQSELLATKDELIKTQNKIPYTEDVKELQKRIRELTYICSALYTLVYEKIPDVTLPDFEHPEIPDDTTEEPKEPEITEPSEPME